MSRKKSQKENNRGDKLLKTFDRFDNFNFNNDGLITPFRPYDSNFNTYNNLQT